MFGLTVAEIKILKRLNTPKKIQDFLESLPFNFEPNGDVLRSPRRVLKEGGAHCIEGALVAAAALLINGERPLLLDLRAAKHDFDHVVTLFKKDGHWGAISKTNHGVLRYRDPINQTVRELAMSYFHEYFDDKGRKNLRAYSRPFDLRPYLKRGWLTDENDLWYIERALDDSPHERILTKSQMARLRRATPVEIATGKIVEWKR